MELEHSRLDCAMLFQMPVGMYVLHWRSGFEHAPRDKYCTMTIKRVFFRAHQSDLILFQALTQSF
jgi:hypothetical protein